MAKLKGAALGALGGIIATAVFAGTAVVGCGDDTGGTPTDGGGADQTSGSSSGGSSSGSSGSSSSSSGSGSSSSSSGAGGGDAGDARAPDADAAITLDAEAGLGLDAGGDADAAPACTTTTIATADGGSVNVGEGGTGQLFYSFDNGLVPAGWTASTTDPTDAGLTATLSVNMADGHTCPGALQVAIPFTAGGQIGRMEINYNGPSYTGATFHAWMKVVVPPAADGGPSTTVQNEFINGNSQVYAQWRLTGSDAGLYALQNFINPYPPAFTAWQEVLVPLTADGGPVAFDLAQLGANLEIIPQDAAAPGPANLLLDDIWLE